MANLFENLASLPEELTETLTDNQHVRIERIVSHGHTSPTDFWYDQDEHEWVVVLCGRATLEFRDETVELNPGDYFSIPANRQHRVSFTDTQQPTVWLAVFFGD